MQAGPSPAREARLRHRHGVRSVTYVTLDHGNGGILLNLTRSGVAVQSVAAVRMGQQVQIRFELLSPRVRVNARGEVVWSTSSGRCGIRFLNLSDETARQLDEWTLAKLLEGALPFALHADSTLTNRLLRDRPQVAVTKTFPSISANSGVDEDDTVDEQSQATDAPEPGYASVDHLIVSPGQVKVIDLALHSTAGANPLSPAATVAPEQELDEVAAGGLDWLSQSLSGRGLAWIIDGLVVAAAWLLFVLVFLSVLREIPKWPGAMVSGAAIAVAALYWGFFRTFAGTSLGVWLARLAEAQPDETEREQNRFR